MSKAVVVAIVVASLISSAVSFAAMQLSQPDVATSAVASPEVKALRAVDASIKDLSANLDEIFGTVYPYSGTSVRGQLEDLIDISSSTCKAVSQGSTYSCLP